MIKFIVTPKQKGGMPLKDLTGQRFGRLVVESLASEKGKAGYRWNCKCDCGKATVRLGASLKSGQSKSCGCIPAEQSREFLAKKDEECPGWRVHAQKVRRIENSDIHPIIRQLGDLLDEHGIG